MIPKPIGSELNKTQKSYDNKFKHEVRVIKTLYHFTKLFLPYLDCDGSTRFNAMMLKKHDIKFKIYRGRISNKTFIQNAPRQRMDLHYWIETENGCIVDYTYNKWLGKDSYKKNVLYIKEDELNYDDWVLFGGFVESDLMSALINIGFDKNYGP